MAINTKYNNAIKTLALTNDISNPNLLINPNFKINQRGKSTYTFSPSSGYTVDRWKLWNGTLTVNSDNTITFSATNSSSLIQLLENPCTEECYSSVYVTSVTGTFSLYTEDSSGKYTGDTLLKYGLNYAKFTGCKTFAIRTNSGSITLKYAKLEKSTNVTQFIEPDNATELLKCKYFYNKLAIYTGYNIALGLTHAYLYLPLNQKMRINPTIELNKSSINVAIPESNINKKYNIQDIALAYLYDGGIYIYILINAGYGIWTGKIVEDNLIISLDAELY